jgi:hypothetical protein
VPLKICQSSARTAGLRPAITPRVNKKCARTKNVLAREPPWNPTDTRPPPACCFQGSKAVNVTVRSARPREYLTECEIDKLIDAACGAHHRRSLGIHSGLCGCEKFELLNFGAGLHRKPLFIRAHMCLTTEAHPVVAIYNRAQEAATVIAAVHDGLRRLWRWRYDKSSTHARSPIQRAPCPNCFADLLMLTS